MNTTIASVEELDDLLSEPSNGAIDTMRRLDGDLILLGVAGKMGPTLARMARRATEAAGVKRRIIGVSRFSTSKHENELHQCGVETIRCDLLNEDSIHQLPDAQNVIYLAGMKFGSTGQESLTWAMNTHLPALVCRKYRNSRIVAFSTGNVYGLVPITKGGSVETDKPNPVGEYAMSCLGRERMFEHFSSTLNIPIAIVRLNYACEMRYGVLVDLAQKIQAGQEIDLGMGWLNTLWQGDANSYTLQCFDHVATPPFYLNMTGPELLNVREICEKLAVLLGKEPLFTGTATETALLNNANRSFSLFGRPRVQSDQLLKWVADWISRGGSSLGKPTHFESRDGKF